MEIIGYDRDAMLKRERKEGGNLRAVEIAENLLKEGEDILKVIRNTNLPEETVKEIADRVKNVSKE